MKKLKLYHDTKGNTLTVWFDDPQKEDLSEVIGEDIVVMKDKKGTVIGFEKLNYLIPFTGKETELPIEVISA